MHGKLRSALGGHEAHEVQSPFSSHVQRLNDRTDPDGDADQQLQTETSPFAGATNPRLRRDQGNGRVVGGYSNPFQRLAVPHLPSVVPSRRFEALWYHCKALLSGRSPTLEPTQNGILVQRQSQPPELHVGRVDARSQAMNSASLSRSSILHIIPSRCY